MRLISLFCFYFVLGHAYAVSRESLGATFPIQERSLLTLIESRLQAFDGDETTWRDAAELRARRPEALGLQRATQSRDREYIPQVVLEEDVLDAEQRILFHKQTCVNALDVLPNYRPYWIFFDADDALQALWAQHVLEQSPEVKFILTGGDVKDAEERFNQAIFFDQAGRITKKLGITHVPAVVSRKPRALLIRELVLQEDGFSYV